MSKEDWLLAAMVLPVVFTGAVTIVIEYRKIYGRKNSKEAE